MNKTIEFSSGSKRQERVADDVGEFPARFDLISAIGLKRLAVTYGEGSLKYGDHNWRKGQPYSVIMNHTLAHLVSYMNGDRNEDHLAHAAWNLFTLMDLEQTKPEMNDLYDDSIRN